jgi:hypothetical protein
MRMWITALRDYMRMLEFEQVEQSFVEREWYTSKV